MYLSVRTIFRSKKAVENPSGLGLELYQSLLAPGFEIETLQEVDEDGEALDRRLRWPKKLLKYFIYVPGVWSQRMSRYRARDAAVFGSPAGPARQMTRAESRS